MGSLAQDRLYLGFYDGARKIMSNEGVKGLYKGYALHLLSHLPFYSLALGSYHYLATHQTSPVFLSLGAFCTLSARCVVYPLETVTYPLSPYP